MGRKPGTGKTVKLALAPFSGESGRWLLVSSGNTSCCHRPETDFVTKRMGLGVSSVGQDPKNRETWSKEQHNCCWHDVPPDVVFC